MKNLIAFLKSRIFWLNVLGALVGLICFFGFTYKWLDSYTDHGNTITVPDIRGLRIADVPAFLKNKKLNFKVSDSSVYDMKIPAGSVIEQDPRPNEKVKQDRTIYLSITSSISPMVKMPELADVSLRQAEAILETYSLKTGELIYKPDLAKNAVLSFEYRGKPLKAGDKIPKGSMIDLVLGDGYGNTQVRIPHLYNLSLSEALFVLKGSSLVAGNIYYEGPIKDTSNAKVFKQFPVANDSLHIGQGNAIDLYVTQSESILKANNPDEKQ